MRERLRQAIEKGNALEGELEETREKVRTCQYLFFICSFSYHQIMMFAFVFVSAAQRARTGE